MDRAHKALMKNGGTYPNTARFQRCGAETELMVEDIKRGDKVVMKPGQCSSAESWVGIGLPLLVHEGCTVLVVINALHL